MMGLLEALLTPDWTRQSYTNTERHKETRASIASMGPEANNLAGWHLSPLYSSKCCNA